MPSMIQNLSGYLFFEISDPEGLRDRLRESLKAYDVFGTIILAEEGLNLNLSVLDKELSNLKRTLFEDLRLPSFELKLSESKSHPHKRLLIKVKPEIVTMGVQEVQPLKEHAPYIEPKELKDWLDEGRDFLLLDTRKGFEFEMGSFVNAINFDGQHFREFPKEVEQLSEAWKDREVVTFCTGGIRCEKGAPLLQLKGFQKVYQLKGGILKYFEECGAAHWRGDCFVFDHRAAVRPDLHPVDRLDCRSCSKSFNPQENPKDVDGLSLICPACFYRAREQKRIESQIRAAQA